jgi:threonine/homoserine/homoserine lactone efflux protein
MPTDWISVLTELIPLALVISLSPLSIIPAVLILQTPQPRPTGLTFLAGWLLALAALTALFVELSGLIGHLGKPTATASWIRIVIGTALIAAGLYRWAVRKRSTHEPAWMRRLATTTPARGVPTALLLALVNPKVFFMCAAAGLAIGTDHLRASHTWLAVLWFVIVAGSSVAIPVLAYVAAGDRLAPAVARLGEWMHRQHAVLLAGILIIIGILVLHKGIQHLT